MVTAPTNINAYANDPIGLKVKPMIKRVTIPAALANTDADHTALLQSCADLAPSEMNCLTRATDDAAAFSLINARTRRLPVPYRA